MVCCTFGKGVDRWSSGAGKYSLCVSLQVLADWAPEFRWSYRSEIVGFVDCPKESIRSYASPWVCVVALFVSVPVVWPCLFRNWPDRLFYVLVHLTIWLGRLTDWARLFDRLMILILIGRLTGQGLRRTCFGLTGPSGFWFWLGRRTSFGLTAGPSGRWYVFVRCAGNDRCDL
jgi:hypothetical protein